MAAKVNTIITNEKSGTNITEIAPQIYHISTPVAPNPALPLGFSFNQFLIVDESPLLFHTGLKSLFPLVKEAVETVIPVSKLRYIGFSHFEADECGAMNEFLSVAPNAEALCSPVGKIVTVDDQISRPAKALNDNEVLSLGKKEVKLLYTPHTPHGWDCSFLFETTSKTLFGGDLVTQVGDKKPALIENNYQEHLLGAQNLFDLSYWSRTPNTQDNLKRLAELDPSYVCCMHGSSFHGDGNGLLKGMAQYVANAK